jgi:hypothetical protein
MEFKGSEVCKPDERIEVVAEDEMHLAIGCLRIAGKCIDIVRFSLGGIFLVKILTTYPAGITVHGERPVMEKRKHSRGHSDVVGNNLLLGDRERGVHYLAKVGQVDQSEIAQ